MKYLKILEDKKREFKEAKKKYEDKKAEEIARV